VMVVVVVMIIRICITLSSGSFVPTLGQTTQEVEHNDSSHVVQ
jgi:hypothetical protein